jgi:hypothetical protein
MNKYDKISRWLTETIESRGDRRYVDLHVDQVEPEFGKRELWVPGGIECFRLALNARDIRGAEFTVALAFSLETGESRSGLNFEDLPSLESQFDGSPPSSYLFHRGEEPWARPETGFVDVSIDPFPSIPEPHRVLFTEFIQEESGAYARSILLAG